MRAEEITGVILAGGRSVRMGRDKALLPIGGKPLIRHLAEEMLVLGIRRLVVACGTEERGREYGALLQGLTGAGEIAMAADAHPGSGPLAGLHAALGAIPEGGYAFVMACDMPTVSAALFERLLRVVDAGEGVGIGVDAGGIDADAGIDEDVGETSASSVMADASAQAGAEAPSMAFASRAEADASAQAEAEASSMADDSQAGAETLREAEVDVRLGDTLVPAAFPQVVLTPNQPFHALYHASVVPELARRLARNDLRVMALLGALRTMEISVSAAEEAAFVNLNTPELYEQFARRGE